MPKEVIYHQGQSVNEVLFITEGQIEIGQISWGVGKIGRGKKMPPLFKLRFPPKQVLNIFQLTYEKKLSYSIRTVSFGKGMFIRKIYWKQIMKKNPEFKKIITERAVFSHIVNYELRLRDIYSRWVTL
jgi:hypothetical protein